jgi:hypothetical protein
VDRLPFTDQAMASIARGFDNVKVMFKTTEWDSHVTPDRGVTVTYITLTCAGSYYSSGRKAATES